MTLSPAGRRIAVITVFGAGAAVCLLGYLAFAAPGRWLDAPPSLQWRARELAVARGSGQLAPEGLVISAPDATRTVVISLNTSFRARDYPVIEWDAAGVPDNVEATMLWYSDIDASRVFRHSLIVEGGRVAPVALVQDRGWIGRIGGLALVLQGGFAEPIVVPGAAAKPRRGAHVGAGRRRRAG